MQRQPIEPPLLLGIDREGGLTWIGGFGGAHFDKDDAATVHRDKIKLAEGTAIVASDDAIAEPLQESSRRPLGAGAEPAPPPRFAGGGFGNHEHPPRRGCRRSSFGAGLDGHFLLAAIRRLARFAAPLRQSCRLADPLAQVI